MPAGSTPNQVQFFLTSFIIGLVKSLFVMTAFPAVAYSDDFI